jgi:UDP-N-acetylmuramoyl-tripeptide--D-alanyl-D-alanine ligase
VKEFLKKIVINILYIESKFVLFLKRPKIIAITGTVGKTTTKEILYAGLEDFFDVRKSPKGFNSDIGVLLTILNLKTYKVSLWHWLRNIMKGFFIIFQRDYPELLIVEVGANYPGEIQKNAKLLKPDVVIFTKLPEIMAHMEFFKNRQHFIDEKLSLAQYLKNNGVIIYNGDDQTLFEEFNKDKFKFCIKKTFGKNADYRFKDVLISYQNNILQGTNIVLDDNLGINLKGVLGEHLAYSVSALWAVSEVLDLNSMDIMTSLEKNFIPMAGRMRIFRGINNFTIIDDSYNALPESVKNGSDFLNQIKVSGRKIYILGRLAELGKYTDEAYKKAIKYIKNSCDIIFLVNDGGKWEQYAKDLHFEEVYSFNKYGDNFFANTDSVGKFLQKYINEGDIVMFKGARHSTGFERAIAMLIKKKDRQYLAQDHLN